jgi:uncharacterized damage-inducible protein DinB
MHPTIGPLAIQFTLNGRWIENAFANLNDEQASERLNGRTNTLNFILGHLTAARYMVANLAGAEDHFPFGEKYGHGQSFDPNVDYPALEEIREAWETITPVLMERLENADEAHLSSEAPLPFPVKENTIGNGIAFMAMHESYHTGQAGLCRKALDLDAIMQ